MIKFDESKHPRAEDGRFTDGQNDARNKSIKQLIDKYPDEREFVAEACSAAGVD